ncbi:MAG: FMN-binding negative transcriptional regulator [Stenomitos rutilans HA7619-LM2]|jgi:transcriptional regulator|nr:FMN-binding negative transcriptional regulator [Stenomitos rutilans HA7619-LM2]
MYVSPAFREDDLKKLVDFMQAFSFATLVTVVDNIPTASHVPLVTTVHDGVVKLTGHLAKANPQWQAFGQAESLAIFNDPHAYISPSLYEKRENVPTWNYIAVHAFGKPQMITLAESPESIDAMIKAMVSFYEPAYKPQWDALSAGYREGMMAAIVGFEMQVTKLEGKYKLSQNRSHFDQSNVADSLLQHQDMTVAQVGEAMQKNLSDQTQ